MQVDQAAGLVLGDLRVRDAQLAAESGAGHADAGRRSPGQVRGEAAPQYARMGVPQDGAEIDIAVEAECLSQERIAAAWMRAQAMGRAHRQC